jgi:hypothetical protein
VICDVGDIVVLPFPFVDVAADKRRPSVVLSPDLLLGEVHQAREQDQEHEHLQADPLARFHVRLGGPHQEGGDVVGVLRDRGRRTVVERDLAVAQRLRHLDGVAGEILVVVGAVGNA